MLANGKTSSLLNQSLLFSSLDADTRAKKIHLFAGLNLPQNHYHLSQGNQLTETLIDQLTLQGFQLIKIVDHILPEIYLLTLESAGIYPNSTKS